MCGNQSLNVWAEVSGDPTIFENAMMCKMFFPEICAAVSTDAIHDSYLLLVALNISTEEVE